MVGSYRPPRFIRRGVNLILTGPSSYWTRKLLREQQHRDIFGTRIPVLCLSKPIVSCWKPIACCELRFIIMATRPRPGDDRDKRTSAATTRVPRSNGDPASFGFSPASPSRAVHATRIPSAGPSLFQHHDTALAVSSEFARTPTRPHDPKGSNATRLSTSHYDFHIASNMNSRENATAVSYQ